MCCEPKNGLLKYVCLLVKDGTMCLKSVKQAPSFAYRYMLWLSICAPTFAIFRCLLVPPLPNLPLRGPLCDMSVYVLSMHVTNCLWLNLFIFGRYIQRSYPGIALGQSGPFLLPPLANMGVFLSLLRRSQQCPMFVVCEHTMSQTIIW